MNLVNNRLPKQQSHLLNSSGIALPLVLMLLVVFTLVGTAAYTASQSSLKQSARLNPNLQCKYLARSAVDATKEAWTAKFLDDPNKYTASGASDETNTFYTRYYSSDNEFKEEPAANEGKDGVIKTVQTYKASAGVCTITSTVSIGSHSATVTAESEKLKDTDVSASGESWYEYHEYESRITEYWNWHNWTILPGSTKQTVTDKNGQKYVATYHVSEGIVEITTGTGPWPYDSTLYANGTLREDIDTKKWKWGDVIAFINAITSADKAGIIPLLDTWGIRYSVTGLQAKRINFNCPLNLYYNTSLLPLGKLSPFLNPHSLIVSAETIIFEQQLIIGDSAYGNLTLSIPPGTGIPGEVVYKRLGDANATPSDKAKVDLTAKYGLVKFSDVKIENSFDSKNNPNLIKNQAFFFRTMDEKVLSIGTEPNTFSVLANFFGWTKTENDCQLGTLLEKGYLIPATKDDVATYYDVLFFYK